MSNSLLPLSPTDLRPCKRCGRQGLAWVPTSATGTAFKLVYTRVVRGRLVAVVRYRHSCDDGACRACPDPGCDGMSRDGICQDCGHEGEEAPTPRPTVDAAVTAAWIERVMG